MPDRSVSGGARKAEGLAAGHASTIEESPFAGSALLDRDGRWLQVNRRLCAILRYDADELQALTVGDLTDPNDLPAEAKALELFDRGEISRYRSQKRFLRGDGSSIWVDMLLEPVNGTEHWDGRCRLTVLDVSERKHLEEALQRRNQRLVQLAALLGHDLRSVLNVMSLHAQLTKASLRVESAPVRNSLDTIVTTAHDAANFMTQLQEYAGSLTHHADLDRVSLQHIVAQTLALLEPRIQAEHTQVEVGELPRVLSKEAILSRVLLSILDNSLKHCSVSDPRIEIAAISSATRRGSVGLVVRANGAGVSNHEQERMFTALFRSDNTSERAGLGLGLAFCREHIEDIGGSIWLDSAPGRGTQIAVLLPGG
jgi:two-component system, sensor histidine kinase and response regulator